MSPKKKKWLTVIASFLVLALGVTAVVYALPDSQLNNIRDLSEKMRDRDLPREERDALRKQFGEAYEQLSDAQKETLRAEGRERMKERMIKGMEEYDKKLQDFFALPPEERVRALDDEIREDEERAAERAKWMQEFMARNPNFGKGGPGGGRGGPGRGGPGGPPRGGDGNTNNGGSNGGKGGPPGGGRRKFDPEKFDQMRKSFLDHSTPEARARRDEFRRLKDERRKALGLPEQKRGFGFFGRGRGGPGGGSRSGGGGR